MQSKLDEYIKSIQNKKIAFIGIGVSNIPAMKYLRRLDIDVTAFDKKSLEQLGDKVLDLKSLGIKIEIGEDYLEKLVGYDVIFRSPTARFDLPQIEKEVKKGAVVTSEIEQVVDLCPGIIIGVTGSGGKTTTTTIIYEMIKAQGFDVYLGGNIGIPLFDKLDKMNEDTYVVLELSSFQLMTMKKSPHISVVTSLAPDHLDVHKSLDEYYNSKKNIFRYQKENDILVLNYDNELTRKLADESKGIVKFYSAKEKLTEGVIIDENKIKITKGKVRNTVIDTSEIKMMGKYNHLNLCGAILAVDGIVSVDKCIEVAKKFAGVEHRMELIGIYDGVKYINNAIASSPIKAITSLEDFQDKVILIAGGYDKNLEYDEFAKTIVSKVKKLNLMGQIRFQIKEAVEKQLQQNTENDIEINVFDTFEETVLKSIKQAKSGDVVILSPGTGSFDMFKDYMEKGNAYKKVIGDYYKGEAK